MHGLERSGWRRAIWALVLFASGCAAGNESAAPAHPPFKYESLNVRNSCFVESVHFYDRYLEWVHASVEKSDEAHAGAESPPVSPDSDAELPSADASWVRVLQWGNDSTGPAISLGHAVAVYLSDKKLWIYDVNYGFLPMKAPADKRDDIAYVGPEVFRRYPQFKPVFVSYREDTTQPPPYRAPMFLARHENADVRDATKVANELGQARLIRVVAFSYFDNAINRVRESAATVFMFGRRLCVYFPSRGTHLSRPYVGALDSLSTVTRVVQQVYPGSKQIRWMESKQWRTLPQPVAMATTRHDIYLTNP